MATCKAFIVANEGLWDAALKHRFLSECKNATISEAQFNTWLLQDYQFVKHFTRMTGRLLGSASDAHLDTLLSGLGALQDELRWFQRKAQERGLSLEVPMQAANKHYTDFMASLSASSYAVQATAFWAIEHCYNQAWQLPGPMPAPYDEYAQRWGNAGFSQYVVQLQQQADEALQAAGPAEAAAAQEAVRKVAELEVSFWDMAYSAGGGGSS